MSLQTWYAERKREAQRRLWVHTMFNNYLLPILDAARAELDDDPVTGQPLISEIHKVLGPKDLIEAVELKTLDGDVFLRIGISAAANSLDVGAPGIPTTTYKTVGVSGIEFVFGGSLAGPYDTKGLRDLIEEHLERELRGSVQGPAA